ncbi:MAG: hypothetical protein NTY38_15495 [Acidobacteria bacterium]|nr:hypothetical protein [Acidobacteriota bacterium]
MRSEDSRCPRRQFLTGLVAAGVCGAATEKDSKMIAPKNEDFYRDGTFLVDKAKDAYFAMMRKFGYPIPPRLMKEMWAVDFSLGDFTRVGMAGIFWYNDKTSNVFGHEIFLLPGQMIVEHAHESTLDAQAKREAWHVRHGWVCTLGEGAAAAAPCPVELPRSQTKYITVHNWKKVGEGEVDSLGRATAKHFMIAGSEGAIVTEYGTFHDGAGLRFTNPGVKF